MLVNEVIAIIHDKVKDVDIELPLTYIKSKAMSRRARFFPTWYEGNIMAEPNQFLSQEQSERLKMEGFTVAEIHAKDGIGDGTHFSGYTVTW